MGNVGCKRTFIGMTLWHLFTVKRVKGYPCWRLGVEIGCRPSEWESKETFKWGGVCLVTHIRHILHLLRNCYVISVSMSSVQYAYSAEELKNKVVLYHQTTDWLALCVESR